MKTLNPIKFVSSAVENLTLYRAEIEAAEDYECAKAVGEGMFGYLHGLNTILSAMTCEENREFTEDMVRVLENWQVRAYRALVDKARETQQPKNTIQTLLYLLDTHTAPRSKRRAQS